MSTSCLNPGNASVISLVSGSRKNFPMFRTDQIIALASIYNDKYNNIPSPEELLDFYAAIQPLTPKEMFDQTDVTEKQDVVDLLQGIFFKGLLKVTKGNYLTKAAITENKDKILNKIPGFLNSVGLNVIADNYDSYKEFLKSRLGRLDIDVDFELEAAENQASKDNNWDKDSTFTDNYARATDETIYLFASLTSNELIKGIPRPLPIHSTWNVVQNLLAGTSDINTQVTILRRNLDKYPFITQILDKLGYGDFDELSELSYSSIRTSFTASFSKNINSLMVSKAGKQTRDNVDFTTKLTIKEKWKSNFHSSLFSKIINNKRVFNPDKLEELLNEPDNQTFLNNLGIYLDSYVGVSANVRAIKAYFLQKVKENNIYNWLDDKGELDSKGKPVNKNNAADSISSTLKDLLENQLRFIKETKATGARNANGEYQHSVGLHSYTSKIFGNLRNKVIEAKNEFEKLFYDGIATMGITQGHEGYKENSTFDKLSPGDIYTAIIGDMFSSTPFIHNPRTADKKEEKGIKLAFDKFKNPTVSAKNFYDTKMAYTKISPELYTRLFNQYRKDYVKETNPKWGSKTQKEPIAFWNELLKLNTLNPLSLNEFKAGIDNYIENQLNGLYADLVKNKVITYREGKLNTTFPKSIIKEGKDPLTKVEIDNMLRNYIFNSLMFGTELTQLQMGSLTSVSPEEFFKRNAGPGSAGKIPRTDIAMVNKLQAERGEEMKNFPSPAILKISISSDDEVSSTNAEDYNREGNTTAYSNNNVNDGQGDMLFQSYREYKTMLEEWSDIQEEAWKKMQKGERLDEKRFNNLFPPIKPVGFSLVMIDGVQVPIYIKTSIYPIYPTFCKGTLNEVAYNKMLENDISINLPMSGIKIAKPKNSKDKFKGGEFVINEDAIFEFPTSDLLSQLDIQVKDSTKQLIATQQQKLIAVNMYNNGGVINKDFENWVEERKDTLEKLAEIETKKLEEKAGIEIQDGMPVINNYTKLAQMLREELLSRDMPINTIDAVNSIISPDGKLLNTIDTLPSRQKLMNLLNSIVTNKLIKLYTNGSALVQVAQTGWEMTRLPNDDKATDEEILAIDCAIDFINNDAKIAYYRNNGLGFLQLPTKGEIKTGAAEILLPAKFKKFVDADGKIDPRLITNIGYRIPTQGLNSILHLKVVGFLAPGLDQMVVMPREITTQGGSDFDVDKLNIFMPNSIKIKGEIKYISKDMNAAEIFEDKKQALKNTIDFFNQKIEKYYRRLDKAERKGQEYISDELLEETLKNSEIGGDLEMLEINAILESKASTIEKYQKIYDELSTYMTKEGREKWIGKFEKARLQNEMIEQTIKVLEHPNSVKSLLSPNNSDELKDLAKGLSKKIPLSSTFMPKTLVDITYQMFSAKALVGIFAAQSTQHALAQQVGLHFKSGRSFYFNHNKIMVNGKEQPSLAGVATKTTYKIISDRLGNQYITASVDAAKDPFLFYLGCNLDTGGIFALVERLGGNIEYLVDLIRQPIIQQYLLDMSTNSQLSNGFQRSRKNIITNIIANAGGTIQDSEFLTDYYDDSEIGKARAEYLHELRETQKGNPTAIMMLDDYLYLADAASTVSQSIAVIKFDTSGPGKDIIQSVLLNENYKAFNKQMSDNVRYTLATAKDGNQLPYSRIVTDTILDVFYKRSAKFVIPLYKDLVALNSNYEFSTILKQFNDPMSSYSNGKLDEESATLLYGSMINYVMQKRLGLNNRLFFGENTNARRVLDIQKDENHPLHNNYIMTDVFTPEIGINTAFPDLLTMANKNIDIREQDYILRAFAEIKAIDPLLYEDLIKGNFYQTGVIQSPASYYNLLPNTDLMPIANSLLRNHQEITNGKMGAIMDAVMANIGPKLNNIKKVSPKEEDVVSSRMTFTADRTAMKEYILYNKRAYKKIGDTNYELLDAQNYKSMFYNMDLSQNLDFAYQEDADTTDENPFIESEEDNLPPIQATVTSELPASEYTNHSGGAYGGDTFWDIIGREFGVTKHMHYKDANNANLSKQLKNKNVKAEILTKEQMDFARQKVKELLGIDYKDDLRGNLQVRNFYQVYNADAVYAVAKLNTMNDTVSGGTNTAVQLGIKLGKPVYVWDIDTEKWHSYERDLEDDLDGGKKWDGFIEWDTPELTKNFAGVGSRDIENYNVQKDGKWQPREEYVGKEKEEKAKQAIRDVYENTFKATQPSTSVKEGVEISSNAKGLAAALTNPTELAKSKGNLTQSYPVEFRGKTYKDSEAAYQDLKSTATKDEGPNSTYNLMVDIIKAKLEQHPTLVNEITNQGGSAWILSSTHQPTKQNSVWETGGKNWFIKSLNDAYLATQQQAPVTQAPFPLNNKIEPGRYVKFNNETFIVTKINVNDTIQIYNPTLEGTAAKKSVAMRNLQLLNGKAEIVKHKGSSYIVTPKETIISLTTNKAMNWGEENGDRKEILLKSKDKATTEYSAWNEISEENRENLGIANYTQESFNNLTIEEQNLALRCHG